MSCICGTSSLWNFIRNIANIELKKAHGSSIKSSTNLWNNRPFLPRGLVVTSGCFTRSFNTTSIEDSSEWIPFVHGEKQDPLEANVVRRKSAIINSVRDRGSQRHRIVDDIDLPVEEHEGPSYASNAAVLEVSEEAIAALSDEARLNRLPQTSVATDSRKSGNAAQKFYNEGQSNNAKPDGPPHTQKHKESWQIQKAALAKKFEDGWNPRKRLSPDALAGIRALHDQYPQQYSTDVLAHKFGVSPEAIRRILKSRWSPNAKEEEDRRRRWVSRGVKVWSRYADLGLKPPSRWRQLGVHNKADNHSVKDQDMGASITTTKYHPNHVDGKSRRISYKEQMSERIL